MSYSIVGRDAEARAVCVRCDGQSEWRFEVQKMRAAAAMLQPSLSDFPPSLSGFIYSPSKDGIDSNLLILFHGLGDSPKPFYALGSTFALPQTAILALSAPFLIPFLDDERQWFDYFDESTGEPLRPDPSETRRWRSLNSCLDILDLALDSLCSHGWDPSRIFLFGYAQGGTVALEWAVRRGGAAPFGGVVAVAAGLMEERVGAPLSEAGKAPGDTGLSALLVAGRRDLIVPPRWVEATVTWLNSCRRPATGNDYAAAVATMFDKGNEMIKSAAETAAVMSFFAPRLRISGAWERDEEVIDLSRTGVQLDQLN